MDQHKVVAEEMKKSEDVRSEYLLLRESLAALENEMKDALEEKCIEDITKQLDGNMIKS